MLGINNCTSLLYHVMLVFYHSYKYKNFKWSRHNYGSAIKIFEITDFPIGLYCGWHVSANHHINLWENHLVF